MQLSLFLLFPSLGLLLTVNGLILIAKESQQVQSLQPLLFKIKEKNKTKQQKTQKQNKQIKKPKKILII